MAMGYASERVKKEFMYCAIRDQQVLGFEDLGGISGCHQQSSSDFLYNIAVRKNSLQSWKINK